MVFWWAVIMFALTILNTPFQLIYAKTEAEGVKALGIGLLGFLLSLPIYGRIFGWW